MSSSRTRYNNLRKNRERGFWWKRWRSGLRVDSSWETVKTQMVRVPLVEKLRGIGVSDLTKIAVSNSMGAER